MNEPIEQSMERALDIVGKFVDRDKPEYLACAMCVDIAAAIDEAREEGERDVLVTLGVLVKDVVNAPHSLGCGSIADETCDCWKSKALAPRRIGERIDALAEAHDEGVVSAIDGVAMAEAMRVAEAKGYHDGVAVGREEGRREERDRAAANLRKRVSLNPEAIADARDAEWISADLASVEALLATAEKVGDLFGIAQFTARAQELRNMLDNT